MAEVEGVLEQDPGGRAEHDGDVVLEEADLQQVDLDRVLGALDARLIAHVLVDDQGDDAARHRPEDQIEPGVLLAERREQGVEESTGDGVEAVHGTPGPGWR